jgi:hypothetical protein
MIKYRKKNFLVLNSKLIFLKMQNILFLKNILGYIKIYMFSKYFYKNLKNNISFLFTNRKIYNNFLNNFYNFFNKFFRFFFFRLKLRGLGYRIKKITKKLYRFFFAFNHYFYFHISKDIFFKHRRRNLIVFSNNLIKLNDIFSHLLLLKKIDFYERNNTFVISKKILFFKKRK